MIGANLGPLFERVRIDTGTLCDPEERAVAAILNGCVGSERAMKVPDVARACGIGARKVQSIVRHLIVEHRAPIGTGSQGWFLVETADEHERVVSLHRNRALSELETMAAHDRRATAAFIRRVQTDLLDGDAA